jgi:hypothetical protein
VAICVVRLATSSAPTWRSRPSAGILTVSMTRGDRAKGISLRFSRTRFAVDSTGWAEARSMPFARTAAAPVAIQSRRVRVILMKNLYHAAVCLVG